jgi:hypothetical protein
LTIEHHTSSNNRRKVLPIAAGIIAAGIIAWMIFRPDRVAQLNEVPPELVTQLQAAMQLNRPLSAAVSFRYRESTDGVAYIRKQLAEPLTPAVLRRNSKRYDAVNELGALEETSSIAIGPIVLLRHWREPPPFVGDLLPGRFWHTRVLKKFEAKPGMVYPGKPGNKFEIMLWNENRYETGEARDVEQTRLTCIAVERAPARNVHAAFTGEATKVRCEESGAPSELLAKNISAVLGEEPTVKQHIGVTENWYIEDLGISVQTLQEDSISFGPGVPTAGRATVRTVEKAEVKLVSK